MCSPNVTPRPHTGSALELIDAVAQVDRCKFVKNTQPGLTDVINADNPLYGGAAILYNGLATENVTGTVLPPLALSRSSFIKNNALGAGGAILAYAVPDPVESEGRVRFKRNVSQMNATLNNVATVTGTELFLMIC